MKKVSLQLVSITALFLVLPLFATASGTQATKVLTVNVINNSQTYANSISIGSIIQNPLLNKERALTPGVLNAHMNSVGSWNFTPPSTGSWTTKGDGRLHVAFSISNPSSPSSSAQICTLHASIGLNGSGNFAGYLTPGKQSFCNNFTFKGAYGPNGNSYNVTAYYNPVK